MYLKGIKLIPFSVLVPVLSNPDPKKNGVFAYLFKWPRSHKLLTVSLCAFAMSSVSPEIQYDQFSP